QPDRGERADREQHCAQNLPEECVGAVLALGLLDAQPQRHEGGVERAFGQQPTKEVGDLQNGEERVGRNTRAQRRRDTDVARESEQARRQRCATHGRDVARERHGGLPPPASQLAARLAVILAGSRPNSIEGRLAQLPPRLSGEWGAAPFAARDCLEQFGRYSARASWLGASAWPRLDSMSSASATRSSMSSRAPT